MIKWLNFHQNKWRNYFRLHLNKYITVVLYYAEIYAFN